MRFETHSQRNGMSTKPHHAKAGRGSAAPGTKAAPGPNPEARGAPALWGGRFSGGLDALMEEINASIGFDRRLYAQDIAASKAHCAMLARQGIIAAEDGEAIGEGLDKILREIESGDSLRRARQSARRPRSRPIIST